jgi:hypothetical protein
MKQVRWILLGVLVMTFGGAYALNKAFPAGGIPKPKPLEGHTQHPASDNDAGRTAPAQWRVLEAGLDLGVFPAAQKSTLGDSLVTVLRIDPARFALRLLNASAPSQGKSLPAGQWCDKNGLVAAINASMFQKDGKASCGYMRAGTVVNNAKLSTDRAMLVFDPLAAGLPAVQVADLEEQDADKLLRQYGSAVQSVRMVTAKGKNVWSAQPRMYSTAAIGTDKAGRVLFIFCRSPYATHDFINILLALPIDIRTTMYCEGGPEAQLAVRAPGASLDLVGSFETGVSNDTNTRPWPVPNVVGIVRKP